MTNWKRKDVNAILGGFQGYAEDYSQHEEAAVIALRKKDEPSRTIRHVISVGASKPQQHAPNDE